MQTTDATLARVRDATAAAGGETLSLCLCAIGQDSDETAVDRLLVIIGSRSNKLAPTNSLQQDFISSTAACQCQSNTSSNSTMLSVYCSYQRACIRSCRREGNIGLDLESMARLLRPSRPSFYLTRQVTYYSTMMPLCCESLSNPATNNTTPTFVHATTDPSGLLHLAGHNRMRYARRILPIPANTQNNQLLHHPISTCAVPWLNQGHLRGHVLSPR